MLNRTTENAIKVLIYLSLAHEDVPTSPKFLAEQLGESPTYMAKVIGYLVKAGILRSHRGVSGGATLCRRPEEITLLEIVEACQGKILGDFCQDIDRMDSVCSFHQAMYEIHEATTAIMKKWKLSDLAENPIHRLPNLKDIACKMMGVCPKKLRT